MAEDEEEICHLFGAAPVPLGSHNPGARETGARWRSSAARRRRTPDKLLNRAGAYRVINISAAAVCRLFGLEVARAPVNLPVPGDDEETEARCATRAAAASAPRGAWDWLPLASSSFPRPDPVPTRPGEPVDLLQERRLRKDMLRSELLGRRAINRKLVIKCLDFYNSMHPANEYEPAPGVVTKYSSFYDGQCWTHGNFVARRKRCGFFSFVPTPRKLFFFEVVVRNDFRGVVACIALDEPVTEAYTFFGFPLGWGTRRDGSLDCICKTCYRHYHNQRRDVKKTFACGHEEVEAVCDMCYRLSGVLHPIPVLPGESASAYRKYRKLSLPTEKTF